MRRVFDDTIRDELTARLRKLEAHFKADVIFQFGEIHPAMEKSYRDFIEELIKEKEYSGDRLVVILNTPGGSAETVEKMVNMIRYHYKELFLVVPDYAMSAGTIFCMAADKIYMDYSSSLGPIDPQVYNGKQWVPALGYLDKVEALIEKSRNGTLTEAEFLILQKVDLAELRSYEMARDLTVSLLKQWLVKFKFKNWTQHRTNNPGTPVTAAEKEARAEEIAKLLGNNAMWHSHGRSIGIETLIGPLHLEIDDYSKDDVLRNLIRDYNDLICEYINRHSIKAFVHSRVFF